MTRLAETFARLRSRNEAALVTFLTAGDPSVEGTPATVAALAEAGADIVELGIPYSDPLADGPSIQASSQRALDRGVTPATCLRIVRDTRALTDVPLVLMTSYNVFLRYGLERFAADARSAGADGAILTDLPPEEAAHWKQAADAQGLSTVFLVTPLSSAERIAAIAAQATGFIYCVSRTGVTGAQNSVSADVNAMLARVRQATDKPACVGFGISTPEHVTQIAAVADGAVIGSALVDFLHRNADNPARDAEMRPPHFLVEGRYPTQRIKRQRMYNKEQFAKMIDNTLLRPDSTKDGVLRLCAESADRHFASVCILPCWVGTASRALQGTDVKVCTVVAFPFGATTRLSKVFETKNAIANGAKEIDAVLNISKFKSGDYEAVAQDIRELVEACRTTSLTDDTRQVLLKVIIETCFLTDEEKDVAARLVRDAGADFVKTSTGTASGGATAEDIRRIRRAVGLSSIGIKASGGIKTVQTALQMLDAGANRIGTSSGAALYDAYRPEDFG